MNKFAIKLYFVYNFFGDRMKLIVGLGNPGEKYENTRHNIGFIILDNYLGNVNFKKDFSSLYYKKDDIYFQKPQTYMNDSGLAIAQLINYYKIDPKDVYVFYDDMDLEFGAIRIRDKGSSGGHNGIKSIISHIGSDFVRIRFGIGKKSDSSIGHVLGSFSKEQLNEIDNMKSFFNFLIDDIINGVDIEKIKTKYNKKK